MHQITEYSRCGHTPLVRHSPDTSACAEVNEITVENLSNRVRTVILPIDISKLLEEDKEYIISYETKLFDKHRLKYISSQIPKEQMSKDR